MAVAEFMRNKAYATNLLRYKQLNLNASKRGVEIFELEVRNIRHYEKDGKQKVCINFNAFANHNNWLKAVKLYKESFVELELDDMNVSLIYDLTLNIHVLPNMVEDLFPGAIVMVKFESILVGDNTYHNIKSVVLKPISKGESFDGDLDAINTDSVD